MFKKEFYLRVFILLKYHIQITLLLVHMKCNRHTQHIIRLVNINIVGVSTLNYTLVVTPEIHHTLVARYVLVHEIYIIIYAYEIDQMQVIFYLVSTFKLHCYGYT